LIQLKENSIKKIQLKENNKRNCCIKSANSPQSHKARNVKTNTCDMIVLKDDGWTGEYCSSEQRRSYSKNEWTG